MTVASVDEQGRVYIPKDIREEYGKNFRIIDTRDGLIFMPLPEDPLETFQEGEKLGDKSIEDLKDEVRKGAQEQVSE